MNKTVNKSISIPIELYEKLKKLCKEENRGLSNLIITLINKGMNNEKRTTNSKLYR